MIDLLVEAERLAVCWENGNKSYVWNQIVKHDSTIAAALSIRVLIALNGTKPGIADADSFRDYSFNRADETGE